MPPASTHGGRHGAPSAAADGARVTAIVTRLLGQEGGTFRYEVVAEDRPFVVRTGAEVPPGTRLELVRVPDPAALRLQIVNALLRTGVRRTESKIERVLPRSRPSPPRAPTPALAMAPESSENARGPVATALRSEGVVPDPRTVDRIVTLAKAEAIPIGVAGRVAARLVSLDLPLTPALLRGGEGAEHSVARGDPAGAVEVLVSHLKAVLPDGELRAAVFRDLRRGAALSPRGGAALGDAGSDPPPGIEVVRARPVPLIRALQRAIEMILAPDATIRAIRETLAALAREPSSAAGPTPRWEARVRALLTELPAGSRASGGARGEAWDELRPLTRHRASVLLRELLDERIANHPMVVRLRPMAREVLHRAEVAAYLAIIETAELVRLETSFQAGILASKPPARLPYQLKVRDERRPGGSRDEMGFVLDVEAPRMGRVRVVGRLRRGEGEPGNLAVRLGAARPETESLLGRELPRLTAALDDRGYRAQATVTPLGAPFEIGEEPRRKGKTEERGIDVRG